ncbi:MAG TPA: ClbS/DfsB family four-helix bundle protein, partial [Anaerolineales bacterium]
PYPKDKEEMMLAIDREWTALMRLVESLTAEEMTTPDSGGWSPKDNLAHLSVWMDFMVKHYLGHQPEHIVLNIDAKTFNGLDEDGQNAVIFERNRARSTDDVLTEFKSTYKEIVKTLNTVSFPNLMKPFNDDPSQPSVLESVLGDTSEHFAEHRGYIERAVKANKS